MAKYVHDPRDLACAREIADTLNRSAERTTNCDPVEQESWPPDGKGHVVKRKHQDLKREFDEAHPLTV